MFGEYGKCLLQRRWRAIASTLTHEQDVLDVVFYDRPRLVGLPVKTSAIPIGFRYAVRDFVPDDWRKVARKIAANSLESPLKMFCGLLISLDSVFRLWH